MVNQTGTQKPTGTTIMDGVIAGITATLPMTVVMMTGYSLLPWHERYSLPLRQIVDKLTKRMGIRKHTNQTGRQALTLAGHLGYGAAMGAVYAPIANRYKVSPLLGGALFAMAVWGLSYMGWLPAAQILPPASKHPARRNAVMIVAHLVWGTVLAYLTRYQLREE
jgi:uncharacterized membrane protein YagU involved in acid resistance